MFVIYRELYMSYIISYSKRIYKGFVTKLTKFFVIFTDFILQFSFYVNFIASSFRSFALCWHSKGYEAE